MEAEFNICKDGVTQNKDFYYKNNIIYFYPKTDNTGGWAMVFNATFNNISVISWWSFYWWTKLDCPEKIIDLLKVTDCTGSCKSNYHTTTTATDNTGNNFLLQTSPLIMKNQLYWKDYSLPSIPCRIYWHLVIMKQFHVLPK